MGYCRERRLIASELLRFSCLHQRHAEHVQMIAAPRLIASNTRRAGIRPYGVKIDLDGLGSRIHQ